MNRTLQIVLTLAFVVALGAVLIQPILQAVDATDPSPAPTRQAARREPSPEPGGDTEADPSATPTEAPEPGTIEGPLRTRPLFDAYPARCLEAASPVRDRLVFVRDGVAGTATAFRPIAAQGRIAAAGLVGLDAGAQTFATYVRPRDVLFSPWEGVAGADGRGTGTTVRLAAWSPISGCGLTVTRGGRLRVVPEGAVLVRAGVTDFAYSPDGRRVAIVIDEGSTTSLWVAPLDGPRMRELHRIPAGDRVKLLAWDTDGRTLYLTQGRDDVRFVTTSTSPRKGSALTGRPTAIEHCPDRVVAVSEGAIVELAGGEPLSVTESSPGYTAVSCSPDGRFLAAIRDGSAVLLDASGAVLTEFTPASVYRDFYVDWGSGGTGLLLGRVPESSELAELWHVPEGGSPRDTGIRFRPRHDAIDWSASPPTGLP